MHGLKGIKLLLNYVEFKIGSKKEIRGLKTNWNLDLDHCAKWDQDTRITNNLNLKTCAKWSIL